MAKLRKTRSLLSGGRSGMTDQLAAMLQARSGGPARAVAKAGASALAIAPAITRTSQPGVTSDAAMFAPQRAKAVRPDETLGVSGVATFAGYVVSGERDRDLTGNEKWRTWDEITRNVEVVSLGASYFLDLVAKPAWTMEPADDTDEAKDVAEFVEDVLADLATPFPRTLRKAAMYVFRGFSLLEWTAKRREDGRIGILDIEHRPQNTIEKWDLDEFGVVQGVVQRSPRDAREIYIPRGKLLHLVDDTFIDSPEGMGVFRCITSAARRLQRYEQLEGFGFEGDLRGIPVARAPLGELNRRMLNQEAGYSGAEVTAMLAPIKDFMENHVRALELAFMVDSDTYRDDNSNAPSSVQKWALDIMQGGATSQEAVGRAIDRVTTSIARRLGIEHLMMGGQAAGTYGASDDKSNNLAIRCDSCIVGLQHVVRMDLVKAILILNGIPPDLLPKPKTDKLQWRSLNDLSAFIRDRTVAGAPITPGSQIDNAILDVAGLPKVNPEEAMDSVAAMAEASLLPGRNAETVDQEGKPAKPFGKNRRAR